MANREFIAICHTDLRLFNESKFIDIAFKKGKKYEFVDQESCKWYRSVNELGEGHYFDYEGEDAFSNWFKEGK